MSYINIETGQYPISAADLITLFPDLVGPTPPPQYQWVFPSPQPAYDPIRQAVQEIAPALSVKDTWEQQWHVNDLDPEQIAANIEAKRIAAVPASVSPRQIRQAMSRVPFGEVTLRQVIEDTVAAGDQDLKDWYEFATDFARNNEHVTEMAVTLSVTERQLDDLFTLAGTL